MLKLKDGKGSYIYLKIEILRLNFYGFGLIFVISRQIIPSYWLSVQISRKKYLFSLAPKILLRQFY